MRAPAAALALSLALATGCLQAWDVVGPYACAPDGGCAAGLVCDDGVCCAPGGAPACPTLPVDGRCPNGTAPVTYFPDRDGDGAGDETSARPFCARPLKQRWITVAGDCNDLDPFIAPSATERCNGLDDDCDGDIDEGNPRTNWYRDGDGDGFGDDTCAGCVVLACAGPRGFAPRAGDCDPSAGDVYPGAPERCDDRDENCNGQRDDPPFADVESPGLDGGLFPCTSSVPGVCAAGGLQCVFEPDAGRFAPRCVPRLAPTADLCGDGLDNDCDGVPDNAPGCGGPPSLLRVEGARAGALAVAPVGSGAASKLPPRCLRNEAGGGMSWLNPIWVGNGPDRHVWYVESLAGQEWDLSRGAALWLDFRNEFVGGPATDAGIWDAGWFLSPVVTVCGASDTAYRRWVPPPGVTLSASQFRQTFPVAGGPSGWTVESGGALDLQRVRAVEVVVSPVPYDVTSPYTFRITFADAGFVQ